MTINPTYEELLQKVKELEEEFIKRKLVEKALRESEMRHRELFVSNPQPMWIYELESLAFLDVNNAAISHYGYSREEFLAMTLKDIRPIEDVPRLLDNINRVSDGLDKAGIWRHIKKDGSVIEVEITSHVLLFDQRRAEMVLVRDITESRKAEEMLRASENTYRNLFNNALVGLGRTRISDGKVLESNKKMAQIFGYKNEEEFVNEFLFSDNYVNPEVRKMMLSELKKTGIVNNLEIQFYRKDKSKVWVRFDSRIYPDKGFIEGVVLDITDRMRAEEELKRSHRTFLTVLDGIDATVYAADMDTHEILFMNRHMIDAFGADLTGQICYEVFRGETGPCGHCTNNQLLEADGNPSGVCVWETKNPTTGKWYLNHDRAIQWIDGHMVRLQIASDISKLKELEQERIRTEAQLTQAQKMESIGTLAGGIAHDFNNILSAVIGYTELAKTEAEKGTSLYSHLQEILQAGGRAKDLVKQILTFSRQADLERKPVQVKLIVKEALRFLRASLPTTIEISQELRSDSLVMADPTQVHQVLMNLCTNAAHAMREKGGVLGVMLTDASLDTGFTAKHPELKPGAYLELTVSDTGHGMPSNIQDRIFDPFFTTKDKSEGTGMGLAVVHGIVGSNGGTITVASTPGQGTIFKVYLPAVERQLELQTHVAETIPTGAERILFIDDEPALVNLGKRTLESLGYRVTTRTSSLEALELFKAKPHSFDLVITDMTMPNMTGDELAKELIQIKPQMPVILCTGYSARINQEQALAVGIRAFVSKPVLRKEIAKTIRMVLDGKLY